jgi:hypothetical protein
VKTVPARRHEGPDPQAREFVVTTAHDENYSPRLCRTAISGGTLRTTYIAWIGRRRASGGWFK